MYRFAITVRTYYLNQDRSKHECSADRQREERTGGVHACCAPAAACRYPLAPRDAETRRRDRQRALWGPVGTRAEGACMPMRGMKHAPVSAASRSAWPHWMLVELMCACAAWEWRHRHPVSSEVNRAGRPGCSAPGRPSCREM